MRILSFLIFLLAAPLMAQDTPAPFAAFDLASPAELNDPHDLEVGPDGRLYVANKFGDNIVVIDPDTMEILHTIGDGLLAGVHDISFGPDGKGYAAVTGLGAVAVIDIKDEGKIERYIQGFPRTEGVLAHSNGALYVMASGTGQLMKVENDQLVASAGGMNGAHDVQGAGDGTIWVGDNNNLRLVQFSQDLKFLREVKGPQYRFQGPRYLDIDDFGRLIVADQESNRVLMIEPNTGQILGQIGDGTYGPGPNMLAQPEGVEIWGGSFYFADSDNNRIVKYTAVTN
jgi:DNA-binding beta-propeller fold protein YncE